MQQSHILWQIEGKEQAERDALKTGEERRALRDRDPEGTLFVVGRSHPGRDFPFVLSPPPEGRNEAEILFLIGRLPLDASEVVLELEVIDIGKGNPYAVFAIMNGQFYRQRIPELADAKSLGTVRTFSYKIPAHVLKQGPNRLKIRNGWGVEDLVLGSISLRVSGDAAAAPVTDEVLATVKKELAEAEAALARERAVIEKRLGEWFTPAKIGLFLHWGLGTSPGFETVEDFDRAAAAAGWSARKWVEEAKRIRAGYITLASFHTCLGFVRPWKSTIPGTPTTGRDYLGELIEAAHEENIKVVPYITTGAKGDAEAYRDFARNRHPDLTEEQIESSFTLDTGFGGGAYTFDVVEELCRTYDIDGLWFDAFHNPTWYPENEFPFADGWAYDKENPYDAPAFASNYFHHRDMVRFVQDLNPRLVTFVNYFPPILESADVRGHEFGDKEHWKVCPVGGPMPIGEENLLIPSGDWWYNKECPAFSFQREIKRTVHSIGCGYTACVSEGPLAGGDLPQPLAEYNVFLGRFLEWAGESLLGATIAGGHGEGGFRAGEWDNGAYGVTTLIPMSRTHYLHVLTAPNDKVLSLPDAGFAIASATNLKTGEALPFRQAEGKLKLNVPDWKPLEDDGDYIIKLEIS